MSQATKLHGAYIEAVGHACYAFNLYYGDVIDKLSDNDKHICNFIEHRMLQRGITEKIDFNSLKTIFA